MPNCESLFLDAIPENRIHLKRWFDDGADEAVVLIHGSVENGKIFYSESGKGFAPWLAERGYDVFVPDLRGRGLSTPSIGAGSDFGQMDMINTDIPAIISHIQTLKGTRKLWFGAHSWGGNLLLAMLARHHELADVQGMVLFGTKRRVSVWNWERIYKLNFYWRFMAPIAIRKHGYLPAKGTVFGADNETKRIFEETNFWLDNRTWTDPVDGFDYGKALRSVKLPPILGLTGSADKVLGHPIDCRKVLEETGPTGWEMKVVGTNTGFKHDYDHINLLTHKDSASDVFPMVGNWMKALESQGHA